MSEDTQLLRPHMVAFIDVMGSKEISKNSQRKIDLLNLLLSFHAQQTEGKFTRIETENGHQFKASASISTFSDNMVISIPLCNNLNHGLEWDTALSLMQSIIAGFFNSALSANFLVRGAIEVGELYHSGNMVFGEALTNAYLNESKAVYPRVVLTDNCLVRRKDFMGSFRSSWPSQMTELRAANFHQPNFLEDVDYFVPIHIDYDEMHCLRLMQPMLWEKFQPPILFSKLIKAGMESSETSYLRKNWAWLDKYIDKELQYLSAFLDRQKVDSAQCTNSL